MVAIKLLVLSLACVFATAVPRTPPVTRNTIFQDERFKGEVFEDVDAFDSIELSRNEVVSPYRLPTTTKPSHYDVLWIINIANLAYSGSVNMTIHSTRANVSEIVVHCDHITPSSVVLTLGTTVVPTTYRLQEEYQFLIITVTNGVLQYNENNQVDYTLLIQFNETPMREDMYGIYKSWFRNSYTDTQVSWMATTQFQATAARYAFPCYDEPSFKATFDITIRRPTTHRSWSCTRLRETRNTVFTGYQEDVFYTTPVMSTYLLALIVAEYNSIEATSNGLLMHEVIARPGALSAGQGAYAQTTGQALLAEMNDHTAYNFYQQNSNLKMTQAAIPDFGAGAMENWGLLTYREAYLMYDEAHTNSYFKQLIAYILSHEIAHMWFGNLVTNDWWDVLWLNEGFARYYQYFLTYWVEDMGLATRFITEQVHTSLLSDSANNPQPLTNPGVGSPAAVSAMFSTITYNKGAAVIRMTEHLLGFEVHRAGLRNYLQSRQFNTSLPSHLFNALALAGNEAGALTAYGSDFDFSEYYRSWTEQPGHPVINVQVNHTTGEMIIYQRRFNINTGYSSINTNYIVPITFTTGASPNFVNTKPSHVLSKAITVINRGVVGDHWVLFNIQQTGFYRVNYDDYTWDLIILALRGSDRTLIHEYNRAQIVNDVFQFARSGLMSYERAFNILSFLEFETEYAPWVAALTGFSWLRNRLAGTPQLTELNNLLVRWANTAITQLTYYPTANESFMRSYLRYQLAPVLCNIGVQACRQAATAQFNALRDTGVEVPVDSRNWVYCNALRDGTQADFNFLWTRFQQHNVYTEKILLLQTLGCTPHEASLNILLNNIVQDNYVIRPQDYTTAMNTVVTGNEGNTQIAFTYMRNNLAAVTSAFGSPVTPLSYVSARLRTINEVNEFQAWATANQAALGDSYTAVYNGAENSRQSILWASEVQNDMNTYFVNGNQNIQASTPAAPVEVTVVTTPRPTLVEPVTPDLPALADSASTTFVSIFLVALAAIANYML